MVALSAQGANGSLSQQEQLNLSAKEFGQRFSTPLQRGVDYAWDVLRGDVLEMYGGVCGTVRGIGEGLYNIGAGLATLDPARIGRGFYGLGSALMPRSGPHSGLGWPGTPENRGITPDPGTKLNNASVWHDNFTGRSGFGSAAQFGWIQRAWTGPGVELGLYGQAYRLVGTVGFGLAGAAQVAVGF